MTELFDAAKTFLSSLSTDQLVALFIGVMALSCAVKFLKDTLSTIVSILGVQELVSIVAIGSSGCSQLCSAITSSNTAESGDGSEKPELS